MLPTAILTLPPLILRLAVAAPPTVSADVPLVPPPTVVGVLGLRDASGALHTLRVDDVDGFSYVGDGVYVPRDDGWWWVQSGTSSVQPSITSAWTVAAPLDGTTPRVSVPPSVCPGPGAGDHGGGREEVLFVGPDVVSVVARGTMDCEGIRPWTWDELRTSPITAPGASAALDAVLPAARDPFLVATDRALARRLADASCLETAASEWGVERSPGRWVVHGRLQPLQDGCGIGPVDFAVPAATARAITGPDELPIPFATLSAEHPGLLDAVASPDGRLVVLFDGTGVSLLLDGSVVDRAPFADTALVMAQWATGRGAARWAAPDSPVRGEVTGAPP